jgi:outer membrane receptor protein involved in Fe transport
MGNHKLPSNLKLIKFFLSLFNNKVPTNQRTFKKPRQKKYRTHFPTYLCGLFLFFTITDSYCQALEGIRQGSINGKIQDVSGKPVAFANVFLMSPADSLVVLGSVSGEDGSFYFNHLDKSEYLLSVVIIGYKKYWEHLMIHANAHNDLQTISLLASEDELEEIQVVAQKPLYEKQIDRMVINVQSSITAAGNTVLEVLQKSPGVMVNRQSSSILLNGKSGVTVMINNRIQRLPMEAVFQMMDGMSAANIDKIELITNPPAKYDAEGMGGIIHLVMVQGEDMGTNGNFGLIAGMNARETLGANFNLNHRKNRFSFFVDYSILYDHNKWVTENNFQINNPDFVSTFHSIMDRPYKLTTQTFRTGLEFDLSKKIKIGTLISLFQRHYQMDASTVFNNHITPDSSSLGTIQINELNVWNHFASNIHLTHQITNKSSLRLDMDYNLSKNNNPSSYDLDFYYPKLQLTNAEMIDMTKMTPITMKVVGLDYSFQPSAEFKFEAGVKGTFSDFENDVEVIFTRNGSSFRDEELSMLAFLDEDILAGYLSTEWIINESSQVNAGLRFENTRTDVRTATGIGNVYRDFGNYFPSIFYKKTINDNLNFNLGYSRRIQRPTFNELAPFVFFVDPNTFFSGNPALLPAFIEAIKADMNFKRANLSLEYSHTKNPIGAFQPEFDSISLRQTLRSQNLDYHKIYSINLNLPWIINDWWDVQLNSGGFYNELKTAHLEENKWEGFFNFTANVTSNFKFSNGYSAEITGMYQSKMNWGMWLFEPIGNLNIGFQKKLNHDKGTLRLTVDDIFYNYIWQLNTSIPEFNVTSLFGGDIHLQAIRLNYTRSFGNKKLRGVNIKSGSEELQKRIER